MVLFARMMSLISTLLLCVALVSCGGGVASGLSDVLSSVLPSTSGSGASGGYTAPAPVPDVKLTLSQSSLSLSLKAGVPAVPTTIVVSPTTDESMYVDLVNVPWFVTVKRITQADGKLAFEVTPISTAISNFGDGASWVMSVQTFASSAGGNPTGTRAIPMTMQWFPNLRLNQVDDQATPTAIELTVPQGMQSVDVPVNFYSEGVNPFTGCELVLCTTLRQETDQTGKRTHIYRIDTRDPSSGTGPVTYLPVGTHSVRIVVQTLTSQIIFPVRLNVTAPVGIVGQSGGAYQPDLASLVNSNLATPLSVYPLEWSFDVGMSVSKPFAVRVMPGKANWYDLNYVDGNGLKTAVSGVAQTFSVAQRIVLTTNAQTRLLVPGLYTDSFTLVFADGGVESSVTIPVRFRIDDGGIAGTTQAIALGGASGESDLVKEIPALFTATGGMISNLQWEVASKPSWAKLSRNSGNGTQTVSVTVDRDLVPEGQSTGVVEFQTKGSVPQISSFVNLAANYHRKGVVTSANTVLLSSMGGGFASMNRRITVRDIQGGMAPYSATSNQSWLSVNGTGAAGTPLQLSANPAGLATDVLHEAVVTVTSVNGASATDSIKVGFWVGSGTLTARSYHFKRQVSTLLLDSRRPVLYFKEYGVAGIQAYNYYSGSTSTVLPAVAEDYPSLGLDRFADNLYVQSNQVFSTSNSSTATTVVNLNSGLLTNPVIAVNRGTVVSSDAMPFRAWGQWLPGSQANWGSLLPDVSSTEAFPPELTKRAGLSNSNKVFGTYIAGLSDTGLFAWSWIDIDSARSGLGKYVLRAGGIVDFMRNGAKVSAGDVAVADDGITALFGASINAQAFCALGQLDSQNDVLVLPNASWPKLMSRRGDIICYGTNSDDSLFDASGIALGAVPSTISKISPDGLMAQLSSPNGGGWLYVLPINGTGVASSGGITAKDVRRKLMWR